MRTKSFLPLTAWVLALSLFLSGCSLSSDGGETQSAPETGSAEQSVSENSGGSSSSQSSQNQTPRDLSGLKLSILGDSISTFDGYIPTDYNIFYPGSGDISTVEKTWWWQVMNATGMELNANASSSNTTITGDSLDTGNARETVFLSMMRPLFDITSAPSADFKIGKYTFEVGGRNKKQHQISGIDNAFIVKDDIEYGYANVVPLWAFGLLY